MKKFTAIGFLAALLFFVTLLSWQHLKPSRDEKIRRNLTGTWAVDFGSFTVRQDGSYIAQFSSPTAGRVVTNEGTFQVRDGYMINTMTKSSRTNAHVPYVSRVRILQADSSEMVIDDGGKVGLVLRKNTK
jgi:hypothetical protein